MDDPLYADLHLAVANEIARQARALGRPCPLVIAGGEHSQPPMRPRAPVPPPSPSRTTPARRTISPGSTWSASTTISSGSWTSMGGPL